MGYETELFHPIVEKQIRDRCPDTWTVYHHVKIYTGMIPDFLCENEDKTKGALIECKWAIYTPNEIERAMIQLLNYSLAIQTLDKYTPLLYLAMPYYQIPDFAHEMTAANSIILWPVETRKKFY